MSVGFTSSSYPTLRQGTLVDFVLPYTQADELKGNLRGIVLSDYHYNKTNGRPCICPIIYGENALNMAWGVKMPTRSGIKGYARPDLTSFISIPYGRITPVLQHHNGEPTLFSCEFTQKIGEKLIETIRPTPEKFAQAGHKFLAYGEIGWSDQFPRGNIDISDPAPVINLTPPETYRETGIALLARAYSHLERYIGLHDVAVSTKNWFSAGFFTVNDLRAVPISGMLAMRSECRSFSAGERALKGFAKKAEAKIDPRAYHAAFARYGVVQGSLPPHIVVDNRRAHTPHFR